MAEDLNAGRLHLDAYIDTTGATRGLQTRINRDTANVRAKIRADIDARGLSARAREAAAVASKAATVTYRADIDGGSLATKVRQAATTASRGAVITFRADLDTRNLTTQVRAVAAQASRDAVVKIRAEVDETSLRETKSRISSAGGSADTSISVGADTGKATRDVDAWKARQQVGGVDVPVGADTSAAESAFGALGGKIGEALGGGLSMIPMLVGGIYTLGAAAGQLAGGLVAVASAASQAVTVLAALPAVLGAAAQGMGALLLGFSGIGGAVKALGAAHQTAAKDAKTSATAQVAAAHAVQDARYALAQSLHKQRDDERAAAQAITGARRGITDAYRQRAQDARAEARTISDARRAISDAYHQRSEDARAAGQAIRNAEYGVAQAQKAVRDAQVGLTAARKQARQEIAALNQELRLSAGDETVATNALIKAKQDLQDVQWDKASSDQQKRAAQDAVIAAQQNLDQVTARHKQLQKDTAEANRKGVEGSDVVKQAKDTLAGALHQRAQATQALGNARHNAAETEKADNRAIADAQRNLSDARAAAAAKQQADNRAIAAARQNLATTEHSASDQARADAHAVMLAQRGLRDAHKTVTTAATQQSAAQLGLANAFQHLSPAGQRFAKFLQSLLPRFYRLRNAVQTALLPPIQRGIQAALPLLDTLQTGLVRTATIMGRFGERLGRLFGSAGFNRDVSKVMGSNNRVITQFGRAAFNLLNILTDLTVVAGPHLLEPFARWVNLVTKGWKSTVQANRQNGKLAAFFDRAAHRAANLGDIVWNLVKAIYGVGRAAQASGGSMLENLAKVTERWAKAANSPAGQKQMRKFFDSVKPVVDQVGLLLVNIGKFITLVGGSDTSPVLTFFKTLNAIMEGLNKLMAIPGVGPVVGQVMALAGVGGALGFVAGKILGVSEALGKVAKVTGIGKVAKALNNIGSGSEAAGGLSITQRIGRKAKRVATAIPRRLNELTAARDAEGTLIEGTSVTGRLKSGVRAAGRGIRNLPGRINAIGMARDAEGTLIADTTLTGRARAGVRRVGTAVRTRATRVATAARGAVRSGVSRVATATETGARAAAGAVGSAAGAVAGRVKEIGANAWTKFTAGARAAASATASAAKSVGGWLVQGAKQVAVLARQAGIWLLATGRMLAARAAQIAVAAAQKAAAAAQWLLNAAMEANPIGLVIVAIAALIGGFILLYKHNAAFRRLVQAVWAAIKKAIVVTWDRVIKPAFHAFVRGLQNLGHFFTWLWKHAVGPAWAGIRAALNLAWRFYYRPLLRALGAALRTVGGVFTWLWKHAVAPAWAAIRTLIRAAWRDVIHPVFRTIREGLSAVGDAFTWLWKHAIKPAWDGIRTLTNAAWRNVIHPAFTNIRTGVGKVADAFTTARKAIGTAWDKIRNAVKTPIVAVLKLINAHIIDPFNFVSKRLGGPHIRDLNTNFAEGGRVAGAAVKRAMLAAGGKVRGFSLHRKADNIPAMLTADEEVIRVDAARRMRKNHPGTLEYINEFGELPVEGFRRAFAAGGRVGKRMVDGVLHLAQGGTVGGAGGRVYMDGKAISNIAARQIRLAEKIAHMNLRIMQGGYGGSHIAASGTSHNYPGVADVGPGSIYLEKILRKVGFAAWARNVRGRSQVGSGAHVHAVSLLDPGDRGSPQVYGSWRNHGNGLRGANNDPAPHYAWIPNLRKRLGGISTSALGGGADGKGGGGGFSIPSFLSTLGSKIAGVVKAPAKWLMDKASAGIRRLANGNMLSQMVAGAPRKLVAAAGDKIKSLFGGAKTKYNKAHPEADTSVGPGGVWTGKGGHLSPAMAAKAAHKMMPKGWSWSALNRVVMGESGWRWNAQNPTSPAYGIPQALPGSKMRSAGADWHDNALTQIRWMFGYIKRRYVNPDGALRHENQHGWYDDGGPLYPGATLAINRTGKTETVFTNDNMVDLADHLATAARVLTRLIGSGTGSGSGAAPLVGNLTLHAQPADMPSLLGEANHRLRVIRAGGVHVKPAP